MGGWGDGGGVRGLVGRGKDLSYLIRAKRLAATPSEWREASHAAGPILLLGGECSFWLLALGMPASPGLA